MDAKLLGQISSCLEELRDTFSETEAFKSLAADTDALRKDCNAPVEIMVMGSFSTGKSSFINALLGQELTVVGALPTTAVITKIVYGINDTVKVVYRDKQEKEYDFSVFKKLTSESGDGWKKEHEQIEYVEISTNNDILKNINIIDSPGLDTINEQHIITTKRFVNEADVVFWVFSVENGVTSVEMENLQELDARLQPIAIVNKMDTLDDDEDDPDKLIEHFKKRLRKHVKTVIGISAEYMLQGIKEKDAELIKESNIPQVKKYVENEIIPNSSNYKINSLIDRISLLVYFVEKRRSNYQKRMEHESDTEKKRKISRENSAVWAVLLRLASLLHEYSISEFANQNPTAYLFEATLYLYGLLDAKDEGKAVALYEYAAKYNSSLAKYILACYHFETYLQNKSDFDSVEAKKWADEFIKSYVEHADLEELASEIYFILGYLVRDEAEKNQNKSTYQRAIEYFKKSLKCGEYSSASELGYIYQHSIVKDYKKAFEYYSLAAEHGIDAAEYNLGTLYYDGIGCEKDVGKALTWIERAAKQGHLNALISIGSVYLDGEYQGYNDLKKGFEYLNLAAERDAEGKLALLKVYAFGIEGKFSPDYAAAVDLGEKIIDIPEAKALTGHAYLQQHQVEKGLPLLEQALTDGYEDIRKYLSEVYFYGIENQLDPDYQKVLDIVRPTLEESADYQCVTGLVYLHGGHGVDQDTNQAIYWLERAANGNDAQAQFILGKLYFEGEVVPQDRGKAENWSRKAVVNKVEEAKEILNECIELKKFDNTFNLTIDYSDSKIKEHDYTLKKQFRNYQKQLQQIINEDRDSHHPAYREKIAVDLSKKKYNDLCRIIGMYIVPAEAVCLYSKVKKDADSGNILAKQILNLFYLTDIDKIVEKDRSSLAKFGSYFMRDGISSVIGDDDDPLIMEYYFPSKLPCDDRIAPYIPKFENDESECDLQSIEKYQKKILSIIEEHRKKPNWWMIESKIDDCTLQKNDYAELCQCLGVYVLPSEVEMLYPIIKQDAQNGNAVALATINQYVELNLTGKLDPEVGSFKMMKLFISASSKAVDLDFSGRVYGNDKIIQYVQNIRNREKEKKEKEKEEAAAKAAEKNNGCGCGCLIWLAIPASIIPVFLYNNVF